MSIRLKCASCQTAFVASDDLTGRSVACPKCGAKQSVPNVGAAAVADQAPRTPAAAPAAGIAEASVFAPAEPRRSRRWRWAAWGAFLLLALAATAGVVAWPALRAWWHPVPPDPIEVVAGQYLEALAADDMEAAGRLGTVEEPPAIRSYRAVHHDAQRDVRLRGSFAPIAALHKRIDQKYTFDPEIGRFTPKNPLGTAAETLDVLHDAKEKAEQDELYKKMASGDPDEIFDAAEGLGKTFTKLAAGALAPKKLLPTYPQLVEESKPPLPPVPKELALDFGENRERWQALLKRPFSTLKADGPFVLERARVRATVTDRLGSSGDPPVTLYLELVRFRLEGIDTRWKVVAASRALPAESEKASAGGSRASTRSTH